MTRPVDIMDGADFMAESQTEHEFMRHVEAYAVARGWGEDIRGMTKKERKAAFVPYHTHISKAGASGFPDLVMVRDGRQIHAELKREKGGRVRRAQRKWLDELTTVQRSIAVAICVAAKHRVLCGRHLDQAERIYGVYIWKPSDWNTIEEVLR